MGVAPVLGSLFPNPIRDRTSSIDSAIAPSWCASVLRRRSSVGALFENTRRRLDSDADVGRLDLRVVIHLNTVASKRTKITRL
jgi:hypothetical protein